MFDQLQRIMTYRSLWALCSTNKEGKLKVSFYCSCVVFGRSPMWGVWNANGKLLHFASGREVIGKQHPHLTWRRIMTRWHLADDMNSKASERREALADEFKLELPAPVEEPARSPSRITSQSNGAHV